MDDLKQQATQARSASVRRAKRLQLLGTGNPACAICGYHRNPASLEVHHVAGEANQELSVLLCRTCHDDLSDTAIETLGNLRRRRADRDPLEVLGALLQGNVIFFRSLADSLEAWASWCRKTGPYLSQHLGPRWWEAVPVAVPR
jgi:hypothetical protein